MFDLIKKIITKTQLSGQGAAGTGTGSRKRDLHVAACVLLLEAAHVDDECHPDEMNHILDTIKSRFEVSAEYAEELMAVARSKRDEAVDLWQFTNEMNRHYSLEEKISVMEDVWRIIFTDGQLEMHEDYFAHKLGNLLRLTHKQVIDAKVMARQQLADG